MGIDLQLPSLTELRPRITVIGVGGAGGNAVNNMIESGLEGIEFIAANTDAQALLQSAAGCRIQMGIGLTEGLGAGSKPEIGAAAAEEAIEEIRSHLEGVHMLFITAGMGGGTGTGAAPVIARTAKELGILTVAVVTKPFEFEGQRRMRQAAAGITALSQHVDTLIVIPNQNLFLVASEKTTFQDAFLRADDVLRSGVSCITNLMIKEGLINLDFADVRTVMQNMGTALMGTGEADGEGRAFTAAQTAIFNPLLGKMSMRGAKGLLVSITGSLDMTLFEVQEAASLIRKEVDPDGNPDINIIVGATFDPALQGRMRVSVVATGIEGNRDIAFLHSQQPPAQEPQSRGRDHRAGQDHRHAPLPSAPQESPRHLQPQKLQNPQWLSRQALPNDESPHLGRRVVLEPKQSKILPEASSQTGEAPRFAPHSNNVRFEPIPPTKNLRKPRRPLTIQDFSDEQNRPSGASKSENSLDENNGRGFFDWIGFKARSQA